MGVKNGGCIPALRPRSLPRPRHDADHQTTKHAPHRPAKKAEKYAFFMRVFRQFQSIFGQRLQTSLSGMLAQLALTLLLT